ncbi:hypothetical protein ACP6PL_10455, partial [Dapis sp. BLCC M126]|uniref:hypothetical protein n=1 Tax=Dapis sp. BLCC M126 TaxID=3400189 RepID=UPI003CEFB830
MRILLKSVLARFKVLLGAVPLIATTYTVGTLIQPRVSFAISQNRDNLSLVNTLLVSTQNISQQSYNVNKNNLELKHSNDFILSQTQNINTSENSQLKNYVNVVPDKHQGANFPNQRKTTNTKNNQFGIEQVNTTQLSAPVNSIIPRPQPVLTNVLMQPLAPAPVNSIIRRPQPVLTNVLMQPVAPAPVNSIIPRPQPVLTNVLMQPVAPAPVNSIIPRPQPVLTNVLMQPVAPAPVNSIIPRPQPVLTNVLMQPVAPAPVN